MEEGETKETGNQDVHGCSSRVKLQLENQSDDSDDEEEDFESMAFPAISPVSNISTSSGEYTFNRTLNYHNPINLYLGFISCGSSSSSKPTTPVPSSHGTLSSDNDEFHSIGDSSKNNSGAEEDKDKDGRRNTSDNESGGELATNKRRGDESDSNKHNNSNWIASSSKGVKARSKYRNLSLSDQSSTTTMRYRKKHISLEDEIVIYESDSSLVDSRRRTRSNHQPFIMFSRISSENQGRTSAATISRHKSEENPSTQQQPSNQIVSILKRKDSSTCTGGNQSPSLVTFSPNVKDIDASSTARSAHRRGILKKRSSLDESSRRYRSHSPSSASSESEKGCMRKNNRRRNSCEEIHHQQGILKQKSYESTGYSSSSGVNTPNSTSSGVQGILKKPSLTPSDHSEHTTKHVSISEAVILAAAELCKDMIIDDEPYIKPILKLDNDHNQSHERRPKPILKKNHSSENEEIRSILKSRKSSRDEDNNL
jgi:hypothetical protein